MSNRSGKSPFEPGEYVLCFEPDSTKARVLYDAKVISIRSPRDKDGKRQSEYTVHFQGWNSSWDRVVPASFVLKNSEENRQLMKKLANTARKIRKNRTRKRRIDQLLKMHFCEQPKFDSDSESSDDDEGSDSSDDASDEDEDQAETEEEHETSHENIEEEEEEEEEETEPPTDGLDFEAGAIDLELTKILKQKLEDDCYFILRKNKLVKIPSEPNVITVLEAYVKNFAINILCATVDKLRPRDVYPPPPEKNVELCKEVMDGLRIVFDQTLPSILLYECERVQYQHVNAGYKPSMAPVKSEVPEMSPATVSPRLRSASTRQSTGESAPKIPRLSPKIKKEEATEESGEESSEDEVPSRRMTRHAYQAEIRQSQCSEPSAKSNGLTEGKKRHGSGQGPSEEPVRETRRRNSLRSSVRLSGESNSAKQSPPREHSPPPLLLPSSVMNSAPSSSRCSTPTLPEGALSDKEGALNGVLSWRLIPTDSYYQQSPPPPAVVYGAHHLLRVFVRLPDLVSKMAIPQPALGPLVKHLQLFIDYMTERAEELFPETDYIDASEEGSNISKGKR